MIRIPFNSDFSSFRERIALDGVPYILSFKWNGRGGYWSMSISSVDGVEILSSIKLVPDYELISQYVAADIPPGMIVVHDSSGNKDMIGRDDVNVRAILAYITEAEVEEYGLV